MEIPGYELTALRRVARTADKLVEAICACDEVRIPGCDFELEYTDLQAALDALPRYYEGGIYIWKEVVEDFQHDAPGG